MMGADNFDFSTKHDKYLSFDELWAVLEKYYYHECFYNDQINSYDKFVSSIPYIPVPTIQVDLCASIVY